jgi:hypothetical protein
MISLANFFAESREALSVFFLFKILTIVQNSPLLFPSASKSKLSAAGFVVNPDMIMI